MAQEERSDQNYVLCCAYPIHEEKIYFKIELWGFFFFLIRKSITNSANLTRGVLVQLFCFHPSDEVLNSKIGQNRSKPPFPKQIQTCKAKPLEP